MTLFGIKEMQEFAKNHDDARVREMWRRLSEARSKNARWCEHANQQDAKLAQMREAWSEYTDYLREKYPPPDGKDFELTCPHHKRIDELLKRGKSIRSESTPVPNLVQEAIQENLEKGR